MTSSMTQNVMTSFDLTSFDVRMTVQFSWEYRYLVLSNYKCVNDIINRTYQCSAYDILQLISYNFSANVANFVQNFVVRFKSS
jgi:hypothetical protein